MSLKFDFTSMQMTVVDTGRVIPKQTVKDMFDKDEVAALNKANASILPNVQEMLKTRFNVTSTFSEDDISGIKRFINEPIITKTPGGKRKSGKRKSGKRKSGKRKSGKRKSGKRKSGKRK